MANRGYCLMIPDKANQSGQNRDSATVGRPCPGPLGGIQVIEFAADGPTAFCGMMLADLGARVLRLGRIGRDHLPRSEEHTSELQSLMRISYAVFCLKKKKTSKR